jgi:hypothetical protein
MKGFKEGELVLWMPIATKIKVKKFRLPWKGPYKVQKVFNNNTIKLSTLSNDDMEKVNIKKLKECRHNDTPIIVTTNVVIVQKKSKSRWDSRGNAKHKGLPWTNSKPRPNKPSSLLWTSNDYIDEIKWLPSGEPRFEENMPKICRINSRKRNYNKLRTTKQLYFHKYMPTTTITTSVGRKYQGNMVDVEKKSEENIFNGELFTMPMNEQPPLWPLAHLLDPRERKDLWVIKHRYSLWKDFSKRDNNHVAKWNSMARKELERKVKSLKIIKYQDTLWGGSLSGKEFLERYARRRHALRAIVADNHYVFYEISEEKKSEKSKCSDYEISNVDNFYSFYQSKLTLKDRREKLQS